MVVPFKKQKLGDLLKQSNMITEDQILQVLEAKKEGQKLGDALLEQGLITEKQLLDVLEQQLGIESVSLFRYPIQEEVLSYVSKQYARENCLIPIHQSEHQLTIATNDPMDYFAIDDIELATGFQIKTVIASKDDILQAINKYYDRNDSDSELAPSVDEDAPAVRIMDQILQTGVNLKASDIHIDPQEQQITVRYRVDGMLRTEKTVKKSLQNAIIARTKILANLNITESRLPQDGRVRIEIDKRPIDLRVSILPTVFGEKIVVRILDLTNAFKRLSELDFLPANRQHYQAVLKQPSGLILLTGPTGSGKTTTLYASITELNQDDVNIITVEDPVEYQIDGVNQVQVNSAIGLNFATGLRSILRQDPNIIMVGEIRDKETAEIAIRSSLTGHLVFSTLHTNSAIAAIPRLFDMGIEPYLVVSSLTAIMAQRLVKVICPDCKREREVTAMENDIFQKRGIDIDRVFEGVGCNTCRGTGYKGRMAIHELLVIDDAIRKLMMNHHNMTEIRDYARRNGMHFLLDDGLFKVKSGKTTLEEIVRVVAQD
ncbi:GspE/PulE family protein [Gracilibacillus salinarum]|uniref:Flp pilus assembly complex ATPase component TadA n=1 Tax=Gracilibacillus salinarum TaxID=2932255 RepID=A0ABY4GQC7_9BACI|nr:ATPase, T2SS/T4P/T4SS family [Gracilibacillus salinarum]UOQ86165.1 Flp pilus assembly complex ATPase component TadA [Gracilibacillus salinarum]